jgi:hypothetical protein
LARRHTAAVSLLAGATIIGGCALASHPALASATGTAATTTTLTVSAPTRTFGNEPVETYAFTVTGAGAATPTGDVTVYGETNGQFGCDAVLAPTSTPGTAAGSCTDTGRMNNVGTYSVAAFYPGDSNYAPSASARQSLAVLPDPTTAAIHLSASNITYGHEQAETVTTTVTEKYGVTPISGNGIVTLTSGSTVLCTNKVWNTTIPLTVSCVLGSLSLNPGTSTLTASFADGPDQLASSTASAQVTVARASTSLAFTLSNADTTYGSEQAEKFTATLTPKYAGNLTGTITILTGNTVLCRIPLTAGQRVVTCTLSAKQLPVGQFKVIAQYSGSGNYIGATSGWHYLSVVR